MHSMTPLTLAACQEPLCATELGGFCWQLARLCTHHLQMHHLGAVQSTAAQLLQCARRSHADPRAMLGPTQSPTLSMLGIGLVVLPSPCVPG